MRGILGSSAQSAEKIIVLGEVVKAKTIDVGKRKNSPGDYTVIQERLLEEATREAVGKDRVRCTRYFRSDICEVTFSFTDRGDVVAQGVTVAS